MEPSEARELKQPRDENVKLKRLVADLSLDKVMLQDVLQKKVLKPVKKREMVNYLMGRYGGQPAGLPLRSAAPLDLLLPQPDGSSTGIVPTRFGYRRLYILLRREGWDVGKSRFYRVYCEENLGFPA
jgi:putative transposase